MSQMFLLGDFIAHIKNCVNARLQFTSFRHSKVIEAVCKILKNDGYIVDYTTSANDNNVGKQISITLRYYDNRCVIQSFDVCSKPSRRVYTGAKNITSFKNGLGLVILSTSRGIMSYRDAMKYHIGGEILCKVF